MGDGERTRQLWWKELRDSAGAIGAVLGLLGALAYVLLAVLCTVVYGPLGVTPADVGLGYGELLLRAGVGLAGVVAFGLALCAAVAGLMHVLGPWPSGRAADVGLAVAVVAAAVAAWLADVSPAAVLVGVYVVAFAALLSRRVGTGAVTRVWLILVTTSMMVAPILFAGGLIVNAFEDRGQLQRGERPDDFFLDLQPPWEAEVVRVSWAESPGPRRPALPRCVLYLGKAEGTTILYDWGRGRPRTLRLPTSSLLIEVLPEARSARCGSE